ncbi:hypothetical protein G6F43_005942 [Rhizopus delemar]|nr:hypothetical protein G6F43_005942 [Rhizopus delemar]
MFFIISILQFVSFIVAQKLLQQTQYIKPAVRWGNGCNLIKQEAELICYGGQQITDPLTESMYALSLSQPWNTTDPAWFLYKNKDPSNITTPLSFFASAHVPANNYFFVDGGSIAAQSKAQTIYFDMQNNTWTLSPLKGEQLPRSDVTTYGGPTLYHNTWTCIDTQTWTIHYPAVENNPPPRIDHTATIIANKYILITGGVMYSPDITDPTEKLILNPVSMSSLLLFDIHNNRWHNVTAGGNIPAPRRGHSAVLSLDGRKVIVFGGGTADGQNIQFNDVFILELSTMQWAAPSIEGVPPKPRKYHKCKYIKMGDYVFVLFGIGDDNIGFNDVNILSVTGWTWINQYIPNMVWLSGNETYYLNSSDNGLDPLYDPGFQTKNENEERDKESEARVKAGITAGVVSGGVVILGGGLFLIISFVVLKRKQKKHLSGSINSNIIDPAAAIQDREPRAISDRVVLSQHQQQLQKPDNRSSIGYAFQPNGEELHKPNVSW